MAAAPYFTHLETAFKKNYDAASKGTDAVQCSLASVRANGSPKIQPIVFQDFLRSDPRVMIFSAATRNSELMSVVKVSQAHEILWYMAKTKETFCFTGRLFIVCASTLSHRFGSVPRNITIPGDIPSMPSSAAKQEEFWEAERLRLWKRLTPALRASFTWPTSGELRTLGSSAEGSAYKDIGSIKVPAPASTYTLSYKFTKLDALDDKALSSPPSVMAVGATKPLTKDEEIKFAHNAALDNFCILIFKASKVDHVAPGWPPVRTVYSANKDGAWIIEDVNP
ncbi:hypothetical protein HDU67_006105 [Dinochytrium kinnereticum]|nr:hypothetical protein HDU67_006105 [Dinochytrium kinnereticum]